MIELPTGARVVSAPVSAEGKSRFGWFSIVVDRQGDRMTVKSRYGLGVPRVAPKDYPAFRRFCEDVDRAMSPRLVIEP